MTNFKEPAFSIANFQPKYKHHVNRGLSLHTVVYIFENYNFDFEVFLPTYGINLQRGLVWSKIQKESFIIAILKDQNLPPIVVIENSLERDKGIKTLQVIDGKQRLTTLAAFLANEFPVNLFGNEYYFKDLPNDVAKYIKYWHGLKFDIHYHNESNAILDDTKIQIFEDVNFLGTPQDKMHLDHIKRLQDDSKIKN